MITDSFDPNSEAIISPAAIFGEQNKICDIAIATFSREIYPAVLNLYPNEEIAEIRAANHIKPIHLLTLENRKVVFYLTEIGSAMAATDVIGINWITGAEKLSFSGLPERWIKKRQRGNMLYRQQPTVTRECHTTMLRRLTIFLYGMQIFLRGFSEKTKFRLSRGKCGQRMQSTWKRENWSGSAKQMAALLLKWSWPVSRLSVIIMDLNYMISS